MSAQHTTPGEADGKLMEGAATMQCFWSAEDFAQKKCPTEG
jgi:hypothetical protein